MRVNASVMPGDSFGKRYHQLSVAHGLAIGIAKIELQGGAAQPVGIKNIRLGTRYNVSIEWGWNKK